MEISQAQELAEKIRSFPDPGAGESAGSAPYRGSIDRDNEPVDTYTRAGDRVTAGTIVEAAETKATRFNLHVGAAAEEDRCIKGLAAVTTEMWPEDAAEAARAAEAEGEQVSLEHTARAVLGLNEKQAEALFDGAP